MVELPQGLVTFCFVDMEGSTRLLQRLGETAYGEVLASYLAIVTEGIDAHRGAVVSTEGDGAFAAFSSAPEAVAASVQIQLALDDASLPHGVEVRCRIGLHSGMAKP